MNALTRRIAAVGLVVLLMARPVQAFIIPVILLSICPICIFFLFFFFCILFLFFF